MEAYCSSDVNRRTYTCHVLVHVAVAHEFSSLRVPHLTRSDAGADAEHMLSSLLGFVRDSRNGH